MSEKKYAVKEVFRTLQGEGANAGRLSVFVRLSGCNVWSGLEEHRVRDSAKGACARFCDTDFVGTDGENGGSYTAKELAQVALDQLRETPDEEFDHWDSRRGHRPLLVLTGGEPSLQITNALISTFIKLSFDVAVETNGSVFLPGRLDTWVTLSPKPPLAIQDQHYDEVKVLYPLFDPLPHAERARFRYVQPVDSGDEALNRANLEACLEFIRKNPSWRLSLQTHKLIGLP